MSALGVFFFKTGMECGSDYCTDVAGWLVAVSFYYVLELCIRCLASLLYYVCRHLANYAVRN